MPMNPPITNWQSERVWVIGASSGIGAQTAALLLERGARVALSARHLPALADVAAGHPNALLAPLDVTDVASVTRARDQLLAQWGGYDRVLIVAGSYTEMRATSFELDRANALLATNLHGVLNVLSVVLADFREKHTGGLAIVASVAGYSGLPKALIYGASKAALINLTESLYLDLRPQGIAVSLICPGFVSTPLVAGNDFPMPALISAPAAAAEIVRGLERGLFEIHFPRRFTGVVKLLRLLPYRLYFWIVHKATGL